MYVRIYAWLCVYMYIWTWSSDWMKLTWRRSGIFSFSG